ncbi:outer membrane receptor protein involved in Fe transport [Novosphingobium capsulatum]|uniref:Outer membrane receptor protein involved in Fe transport n=1 Tax=Novosphingobium capsulatum TaxID=13688 RepID=A0ABU1MJI7_9SPHN|nr:MULTISPECIES: TonB-dependent receptor [Novosphingobium]MBB3358903.1 outer membrane receptor protein involved in Fe transport [Novosphingobium sp. BK256]MBB3375616.1 outer membrane receptor protein involved in Fe transport [Novosphingobium sp. BK280]MBB3379675.1 outer membrane receptor protein involved in Fe transport [Novosphingobium sp. BK258]MBB3421370.1 outer membrane receptor protein involved in Fe transport [Novosphingobium sp. BK267]MBB3449685.1 outer membrane receptor protein involve
MRMAFCDRPGRGLVSIIALAGTSVPAIALAQSLPAVPPATAAQADEGAVGDDVNAAEGGPIVVTGTRIASGFDAPTPVSVMGAERLAERGASNIGDALNELPAFRSTQTPASTGLSAAAGYVGGRILDLRGLGSVRTLTLVDGKRFVPSTTQATVDTNMIPSILLQRAEVVTGGASAVYGSDAVSGVVNLLLDKKLTGYRFNAQAGVSKYGDASTRQIGIAGGWAIGDRAHLILGGEYEANDGVEACRVREWCANGQINWGRNPGQTGLPANNILSNVHPWSASYNGVTTPPSSAYTGEAVPTLRPIDGITFGRDGTPRRFQFGSLVNSLYQVGGESDGPGENIYFDFPIVSPTERYNAMAHLTWEASPALTLEFTGNYGHAEGWHRAVAYRNTALTIRSDNAFLPRSNDPTLDIPTILATSGLTSFTLGKGFDDIGPAQIHVRNNVIRAVVQARYDLGGGWKADAYYQFGRNSFRSDLTGGTITSRLLNAIDSVSVNGTATCRINADASAANDDPACVPLNPFGYANGSTFAAAKAYVTANGYQTNVTTEHVAAANVTGSLFNLPGGPLGIAVGGEYRNDAVKGDADLLSRTNRFFTGGGSLISGRIAVAEGYGEIEAPILRHVAFFDELGLNGAVRRTHYNRSSDFFPSSSLSVTTWKVGGTWAPIEALRLRATRSRDIRAPNVSELFGPTTQTQGILTDPARGGVQTVAPITQGSNPNLQPEKADTFTVGAVIQPRGGFLGRFRASVDYYRIEIKDAISTLGQQNIVTRCFQGDPLSCSLVTRDSSGAITNIVDTQQNVNKLIARGFDIEVSYRQPIGGEASLNTRVLASNVIDLITVDAVGPTERAGQTGLRAGTPPGIPDWTVDGMVTLDLPDRFSFSTHVRWINKGFYNAAFIGPDQDGYAIGAPTSSNTNSVPSKTYVDLLATFRIRQQGAQKFDVFFGVDNLFNTEPPRVPGANGSGNNVLFNPVGQSFKAGVRGSF